MDRRMQLMVLVLLALVAGPAAADEDQARTARSLAAKGQRAFDRGNYDAAIQSFQAAYDTKPHFLMQCNIARCHEMKGNYKEADAHYQRCLDEGADRTPMGSQVRSARDSVREKIPPDQRDDGKGDDPPPIPPGTVPDRPYFAQGGLGTAVRLSGTTAGTQIKLSFIFGYHFSKKAVGPALAADLQFGFTSDYTSIELGPRFYWDFPLVLRGTTALYVAPTAMLGYVHMTKRCPLARVCADARNGLTVQLGVEGRLVLAHRALIFFRPLSFDMLPSVGGGDWGFGIRYDLMFGGGVIF